jgi:hypothetical protein
LITPFFDSIFKQNGFHLEVVKSTRTSVSQDQNSQTLKTQTVLSVLKLRGIANINFSEKVESTITGPYGEEDLYDLATRLAHFKELWLPQIIEKLISYSKVADFNPNSPIANKSVDELREYVCKKAIGVLRPRRITLQLDIQASELTSTHCRECLLQNSNPDETPRYNEESLVNFANDLLQRLSGKSLIPPITKLLDTVATDANVPIDTNEKEITEQKISNELKKLFLPICTF